MEDNKLRSIPSIDRLLSIMASDQAIHIYPRELVVTCLRKVVGQAREALQLDSARECNTAALIAETKALLNRCSRPRLRRVINATGVVLHTNLGRAPLGRRARECVNAVMTGYSTLEYNVETGGRGSRYDHVSEQLRQLTGAEDAIVVNNNAAAVLLVLSALTKGREVIVSRGELVEIGGSFRIPDVLRQSGATLVEVGTTNKTHLSDYEQAIGPNTGAILKVHTSNYRIVGFTAQPDGRELAALAHKYQLPIIEDLGSGTLLPLIAGGQTEPTVSERLQLGFDIVTLSGDKLMGAGQAGIIAGKSQYIAVIKKHPLLRAVRIDKLSLAALEGTLMEYVLGEPERDVPALSMLMVAEDVLKERAIKLSQLILQSEPGGVTAEVVPLSSTVGGGALPTAALPGYGVAVNIQGMSADKLEGYLRQRDIPIIVRIQEDLVNFDVRCLLEADLEEIAAALSEVWRLKA